MPWDFCGSRLGESGLANGQKGPQTWIGAILKMMTGHPSNIRGCRWRVLNARSGLLEKAPETISFEKSLAA